MLGIGRCTLTVLTGSTEERSSCLIWFDSGRRFRSPLLTSSSGRPNLMSSFSLNLSKASLHSAAARFSYDVSTKSPRSKVDRNLSLRVAHILHVCTGRRDKPTSGVTAGWGGQRVPFISHKHAGEALIQRDHHALASLAPCSCKSNSLLNSCE
jgi:hypothetical protein